MLPPLRKIRPVLDIWSLGHMNAGVGTAKSIIYASPIYGILEMIIKFSIYSIHLRSCCEEASIAYSGSNTPGIHKRSSTKLSAVCLRSLPAVIIAGHMPDT